MFNTNIEPVYDYNQIIVKVYRSERTNDTILLIENSPPVEKANYAFSGKYRNYKLHFFSD